MTRLLVTGANGQLGAYLVRAAARRPIDVVAWSGRSPDVVCGIPARPVPLDDAIAMAAAFRDARPQLVIHAAAISTVVGAFHDPDRATAVNRDATARLAEFARRAGARFIYVSTDLVFDGERGNYRESDDTNPLSVYGRTKRDGERAAVPSGGVVARLSLLFGRSLIARPTFFDQQIDALRIGRPIELFTDEWRTPLSFSDAADALLALAQSDCEGTVHVGGGERLSRFEMGERLARLLELHATPLVARSRLDIAFPEPRPRDTSLNSSRLAALFPELNFAAYDDAVLRAVNDRPPDQNPVA